MVCFNNKHNLKCLNNHIRTCKKFSDKKAEKCLLPVGSFFLHYVVPGNYFIYLSKRFQVKNSISLKDLEVLQMQSKDVCQLQLICFATKKITRIVFQMKFFCFAFEAIKLKQVTSYNGIRSVTTFT
jgi:hypothetical protein